MIEPRWKEHKFCYQLAKGTFAPVHQKILELLKEIPKVNRALDVGCGEGNFTMEWWKAMDAKEMHAIEIDEKEAVKARKKGINVYIGDATKEFPYDDEYFDVVITNQVLEHVVDTDSMLRDCYRVLKKEGILVLSVPNLCGVLQRILVLFGYQPTTLSVSEVQVGNFLKGLKDDAFQQHIHAFAPPALKDLLKYHGFGICKFIGAGQYMLPPPIEKIFSWLFPSLAVYLIVEAKK